MRGSRITIGGDRAGGEGREGEDQMSSILSTDALEFEASFLLPSCFFEFNIT